MKHLVFSCAHARPEVNNDRADWLGQLIVDEKPDVVINLGDTWDMESLCAYDRGTRAAVGRNYEKDMEAGIDFNDRMMRPIKRAKKRRPKFVFFEANHEHRLHKALNEHPHLDGQLSFNDFQLDDYYDEVIRYEGSTPGIKSIDGIHYAHFVVSGVMGRVIGGEHHAHSLLGKLHESVTVGHAHTLDFSRKSSSAGRVMQGLVAGTYQEDNPHFAGNASRMWWRGLCIKEGVENGSYDLRTVSLSSVKSSYQFP